MKEEMRAGLAEMKVTINAEQEKMEASPERRELMMRACQGLERAEIKTDVEEIKATESRGVAARPDDRSRDRCVALRSRGQPKKQSQSAGGSRQNLAAASEQLNR
jgi:hypothetical protein